MRAYTYTQIYVNIHVYVFVQTALVYGLYFIRLSRTAAHRVGVVSRGCPCLRETDKNIAAVGHSVVGERVVTAVQVGFMVVLQQ